MVHTLAQGFKFFKDFDLIKNGSLFGYAPAEINQKRSHIGYHMATHLGRPENQTSKTNAMARPRARPAAHSGSQIARARAAAARVWLGISLTTRVLLEPAPFLIIMGRIQLAKTGKNCMHACSARARRRGARRPRAGPSQSRVYIVSAAASS